MPKPNPTLADNIAYIQAHFPHCITESRDADGTLQLAVDFDLLKQALSDHLVDGEQERYRLDWPGKRAALLAAHTSTDKTLRPCRRTSVDFDTTQNLFIEGDNLEALKLLQETYLHKVKMIYIDPPYNTGHDFIYRDRFKQARQEYAAASGQRDASGNRLVANPDSNGRFHSDWLSMMYPRLKLARNLLTDDGVIFISIDENEQANLKALCDQVFGENNFVNTFAVGRRVKSINSQFTKVARVNQGFEYLLAYRKSDEFYYLNPTKVASDERKMGYWNSFWNNADRPTMRYPLGGHNISKGQWKWEKQRAYRALDNYQTFVAEGGDDTRLKAYYEHNQAAYFANNGFKLEFIKPTRSTIKYWVTPSETTILDTNFMRYYVNDDTGRRNYNFDTAKSLLLINKIIAMCTSNNAVILDFFAGSATTAHAVMQLNATDGGNRRFIMVQLPEACPQQSAAYAAGYQTIADIGKERIRRAGQAVLATDHHAEWQRDIGFRVLNIDSSNFIDTRHTPQQLTQQALRDSTDPIKSERSPEDLLFEVLLNLGLDLRLPLRTQTILDKTILFVGKTTLLACFDRAVSTELAKELVKYRPQHVIFCDHGFASDAMMINVQQIFKQLSPGTAVRVI